MAHQLESFAYLAIEDLEWLRAAKLLGAAEALRQASGSIRVELEDDEYNKAMSILGEKLDEYAFKER